MKKRFVAKQMGILLLVLLVALSAAACSSGNNTNNVQDSGGAVNQGGDGGSSGSSSEAPPEPEPEPNHDPVTIRVATWLPAEVWADETASWGKFAAEFKKKYPWITVDFKFTSSNDMQQFLNEQIAAGEPIDVFWGETFHNFVNEGYAEGLNAYIEKSPDFQAFNFKPGILEPFQADGEQWAVSRGNDAFLLFINKELFAQQGVDLPAVDWTWNDFRQTLLDLTDSGNKKWGLQGFAMWPFFATGLIPYSNGHTTNNRMLSDDHKKSVADNPDVLADLQWFQDLNTKDGVVLTAAMQTELGIEGDSWMSGNAAITLLPSPVIGPYNTAVSFDWDVVPLPGGTASQKGVGFNSAMFLAKASKHKEAAWTFMKWWSSDKEAQLLLQDIGGTFPATNDEDLVKAFTNSELYSKLNKEALAQTIKVTEPDLFATVLGGDKARPAYDGFWEAELEGKTPYDYYPQMVEKLNKELEAVWANK